MTEELIQQIAHQIVNKEILSNWHFYLVFGVLMLVTTAASSFLISYLNKRGKNYATKQDFEQVLLQLKESTEATTQIQAQINAQFSHEQERRRLLRGKLEEVIELTYALSLWLEKSRDSSFSGNNFDVNDNPLDRVEMLVTLYFPNELENLFPVQEPLKEIILWMLGHIAKKVTSKKESRPADYKMEVFDEYMPVLNRALINFRTNLIARYKEEVGL